MPWTNPDHEWEMPPYDPEPIDDDPWNTPYTSPDAENDPPEATEADLSDTDS